MKQFHFLLLISFLFYNCAVSQVALSDKSSTEYSGQKTFPAIGIKHKATAVSKKYTHSHPSSNSSRRIRTLAVREHVIHSQAGRGNIPAER